MIWNKKPIDPQEVRELAGRYGLDPLPASILVRRGITDPAELAGYLEDDLRFTHNPFLFSAMETAVDRLLMAVEEGEKVLVFGDRDVDGITSTVILVELLQGLGLETAWQVPRGDEDYGLTLQAVEDHAAADGTLILTVDCGISNRQEIARAAELGIDTLVLDHHNPPEELPPALAVLDPKIPGSGYPFEGLAGCGVALKLAWAVCFARTPLYGQPLCLLNIRPVNQSYAVEAVKMVNLVEQERIQETIVPGVVALNQTRLADFLAGQQILVYEEELQRKLLRRLFGDTVEIHLGDLAPEIARVFPALQGKSLFRMKEMSRMARYQTGEAEEIDVLASLFITFVERAHREIFSPYTASLDLTALGTVADMMPLRGENRILVRRGIQELEKTERPGMQELLLRKGLNGRSLTARDLSWSLAPLINSSGRMGRADQAVELLLTGDPEKRRALAEGLVEMNQQRRAMGDEAWKRLLQPAGESRKRFQERMVLAVDGEIRRGITGILASRLSGAYQLPAVVIGRGRERSVGSIRTVRGCPAAYFLDRCRDLLSDWGGHESAAGFSLDTDKLPLLEKRLEEIAGDIPLEEGEQPMEVDAELPPEYLTPELEKVVDRLQPYGVDSPPLVFMARGLVVEETEIVGRGDPGHLKLQLRGGSHRWPALFWNAADRLDRDFVRGDTIDILFHLTRNRYQNRDHLQLNLLDVKGRD